MSGYVTGLLVPRGGRKRRKSAPSSQVLNTILAACSEPSDRSGLRSRLRPIHRVSVDRPTPTSSATNRRVRPLVSASRTASSSSAFVNRFCCPIRASLPHQKPSTFPGPVHPNLPRFEHRLRANHASGVPRPPFPACRVDRRVSQFGLLLAGLAMQRVRHLPSHQEGAKALSTDERMERGLAASHEQPEAAGTDRSSRRP